MNFPANSIDKTSKSLVNGRLSFVLYLGNTFNLQPLACIAVLDIGRDISVNFRQAVSICEEISRRLVIPKTLRIMG